MNKKITNYEIPLNEPAKSFDIVMVRNAQVMAVNAFSLAQKPHADIMTICVPEEKETIPRTFIYFKTDAEFTIPKNRRYLYTGTFYHALEAHHLFEIVK